MTTVEIYIRKFSEQKSESVLIEKERIVPYFPKEMEDGFFRLISEGILNPTDWILCPIYSDDKIQIGITGTVKYGESSEEAMSRELGEEVGLFPTSLGDKIILTKWSNYFNRNFTVFFSYIKHTIPVPKYLDNCTLVEGKDNRNKVGCYIYGEKENLLEYLGNSRINRYKNEDDLIGISMIPIKDLSGLI